MSDKRSILIAGGGTAGWLTACYLAQVLGRGDQTCPDITVIESPDIAIIGVGEGTFPTIRTTLKTLGIDEARFLRDSTATYKQGIKFVDWVKTPEPDAFGNLQHDYYLHPFEAPYHVEGAGLLPYWLLMDEKTRPAFADAVTVQQRVANASKAPKRIHEGNYNGPLNFAYHFDAMKFAAILAERGVDLGVRHLKGTIGEVHLAEDGSIAGIDTAEHGRLEADLYIDCTGFASVLLGKALKTPFTSVKKHLFTDRAITCQVPYDDPHCDINSYTVSTAHEAGWTWDIALNTRRGIGYVYSSDHTSDDRAEEVLRRYVGKDAEISPRRIRFDAGYRDSQWVKNCVGVGLSGSFFEPLESTGIVLIEIAAGYIAEFFPRTGPVEAPARLYNKLMKARMERITNFIKLHYCITQRQEPFWRDNADPATIPDDFRYLLELWKHRPPSRFDFQIDLESFAYFSYQYILYGMGFKTDLGPSRGSYPYVENAQKIFDRVRGFADGALKDLPSHRDLIDQVYERGFVTRPPDKFMTMKTGTR